MELKLNAQKRVQAEKLPADEIPAVLYGKGVDNQNLRMRKNDFDKTFAVAGESNLIDLDFGTGAVKVLVKDLQRDVLKNTISHVDFYQVNMKEKINAEIPLHFVGEAKAVKELGGTLIKDINALEVECLPGDLVDHIDVDISVLATFADAIHVNDLALPNGLTLVHHTNEMVAQVMEPKIEEEPVAPVAEAAATPAAGAAGAAPAAGAAAPAAGAKKEGGKK